MSISVLGISCFLHDSAAALVEDGHIRACAEEERFTRIKHDRKFPERAVAYCLGQSRSASPIDAVVFYERSEQAFDRVMANALATAPEGTDLLEESFNAFFSKRAGLSEDIARLVGPEVPQLQVSHHETHMASAFYPSPFDSAAIVVVDGVGEWNTTSIGFGQGQSLTTLREMRFPHSLGLLYAAFTYYCGFKVNSGEYKLMGLAPFGEPIYADLIKKELVEIREDGSFRLNLAYFGFHTTERIINAGFERLFGRSRRIPETAIFKLHADIAASIQSVTEEVMMRLTRTARALTGASRVVFAGGVALNCVANGRIAQEIGNDNIWIQPAAGDAGAALGAALLLAHRDFDIPRPPLEGASDRQSGSFLGPHFTEIDMAAAIATVGCSFHTFSSTVECNQLVADLLTQGHIVGVFRGRMEFGPRALGNRSILGDPRLTDMQERINRKIKFRESWRPFAPIVKAEKVEDYFDFQGTSPYMLVVADVLTQLQRPATTNWWKACETVDLGEIVREPRSVIPAVTHVNHTSRLQTVAKGQMPDLYDLLDAFEQRTGCPVLINTSFNIRGEPIVCTPLDALNCFLKTEMDVLVLGNNVVIRAEQQLATD